MVDLAKHRFSFFLFAVLFIATASMLAISLAKGYRLDLKNKSLKPTGIMVLNSSPAGASIFINGKLKSATNDSFSLEPGNYHVELKKEGFFDWKKDLQVKAELVTFAEAYLFPKVPDLKPLTFDGAYSPQISPDRTKIVFSLPLPNPKAGLWILDLNESLFGLSKPIRQIAKSRLSIDFAKMNYFWAPDSRQIILENPSTQKIYLLDSTKVNDLTPDLEITQTYPTLKEQWQKEENLKIKPKIAKLPLPLQEIIASKSANFQFSPDNTKILYQATASAEIPENLIPPVLAASTQKQSRHLVPGKFYVYDIKEDKNFVLPFELPLPTPTPKPKKIKPTPTPTVFSSENSFISKPVWFPTSNHLIWFKEDKVFACEYDGNNLTVIYSGPMIKPFVFLADKPERLIILNQISTEENPNLFSVSFKP